MAENPSAIEGPVEPVPGPVWSIRVPFLLLVVWLCLGDLIPRSALMLARVLRGEDVAAPIEIEIAGSPVLIALISLGSTLLAWLIILKLIQYAFRPHGWRTILAALGVIRPSPAWANALAPLLGALAYGIAVALIVLIGRPEEMTTYDEFLKNPISAALLIGFAVVVAPVTEELFFRGLAFPPLARGIGTAGAVVATTVVFAVVNYTAYAKAPVLVVGVAVIGITLGWLRAWSHSIVPCILAHMTFNSVSLALTIGKPFE